MQKSINMLSYYALSYIITNNTKRKGNFLIGEKSAKPYKLRIVVKIKHCMFYFFFFLLCKHQCAIIGIEITA